MSIRLLLLATALQAAAPLARTPADPIAADWHAIAPDDLLVVTLRSGGRIVIQLAPDFAPRHVANIRKLAHAHWWDGESVYRVQDDYVAQWGDASEKKPLPPGVDPQPPAEYTMPYRPPAVRLDDPDPYSAWTGFSADGWPVAGNATRRWLPHCYAMVGVARDLAPSTGSGGDLYAVIGQAPRQLDRNIAVVGRVIEGIDQLSALPRGKGALGFYADTTRRVPIASIRLASDLPTDQRPHFEVRTTDNPRFRAYVEARANRALPFFTVPAHGVDVCNVPVAVRHTPAS